jgi:DNA-binding NarL/FixJ family response regulator
MKSRTKSMPARKSDSDACSLKSGACNLKKPTEVNKPRKLADISKEVRKLREKGKTVPEIANELKVSYTVVNQLVLRSYKMVARTQEVFDRQEKRRLGLV